jgi:hypothetical protein
MPPQDPQQLPQQPSSPGWTPVDPIPPDGWTPVDKPGSSQKFVLNSATGQIRPAEDVGPAQSKDNSIGGGLVRRGVDTLKGIYHTVVDPPKSIEEDVAATGPYGRAALPLYRVGKGVVEGEKQAGRQAKEQFKTASATKGDPVAKGLNYARAATTAASALDPFATGPVTNINTKEDEGRNREAIGSGAFDALTLIAGGRSGRNPSTKSTLGKLAYATDAESIRPLTHILPDIQETVAQVGKPQTVGELQNVVQQTMTRLDQQFNSALTQVANDKIVPTDVADALESKARSLPRTAAKEAAALRRAAKQYRQPWDIRELNAERMYRNGLTRGFHGKPDAAQMAAMRSSGDAMVDNIVADTTRDVLYDYMEKKIPGGQFRDLKLKQSSIMDMMDHFKDHVEKLEAAQAKRTGAPLSEKAGISTSVHPGGATPRLHVTKLLSKGPLAHADSAARTAFGPSAAATARRAAILALPVGSLAGQRPATTPPPPSADQGDRPQE